MSYQLNVGLHVNDDRNTPGAVAARRAMAERRIAERFPDAACRLSYSQTEPTLVADISEAVDGESVRDFADVLARVLDQDCVAVAKIRPRLSGFTEVRDPAASTEIVDGWLVGPRAAAWGAFNANYFIPF